MNVEQLTQYMNIICDAEGVMYACSGIIAAQIAFNVSSEALQIQARTGNQLQQLYDRDVLLKPYHSWIAVNQLCEYLETGVCTELEGDYGAYAAYRWDVQKGQICTTVAELKQSAGRDVRLTRLGLSVVAMKQGRALREIQAADRFILSLAQGQPTALSRHPYLQTRLKRIDAYLTSKTIITALQSDRN